MGGKINSSACEKEARADTIPQVKKGPATSTACGDGARGPVSFNSPVSRRERTRGIFRMHSVAAGYGASVERNLR